MQGDLLGLADTARYLIRHPANEGRIARSFARIVWFQVRSRLSGGRPIIVPIGDRSHIHAVRGMTAATKAVYGNPPDPGPMRIWKRVLNHGDLFVDIGANVGAYSIIAAELGADVIAVEPNDEARAWLERNLHLNRIPAEVLNVAVGATGGTAQFTTRKGTTNRFDGAGEQTVRVITLDALVGSRTAMVKVDVEGFELDVLRGASATLAGGRLPVLQLELNRDRNAILHLLDSHGYRMYESSPEGELTPYREAPDVIAFAHGVPVPGWSTSP